MLRRGRLDAEEIIEDFRPAPLSVGLGGGVGVDEETEIGGEKGGLQRLQLGPGNGGGVDVGVKTEDEADFLLSSTAGQQN